MDRTVIFRDRQELQSDDNNNMQMFMQKAFSNALLDAVGPGRFFTGFECSATGTWEITALAGRFYSDGVMYSKTNHTVLDLFGDRPLSQKKVVAITTWGQVVETDVQPRDYLIDVETGETEPRSVAMESLNSARVSQIAGSEDAAPTAPAIPNNNVLIALITLSTSGIETIEMQHSNLLPQSLRNQAHLDAIVAWQGHVASSIDSLRSDLAGLGYAVNKRARQEDVDSHALQIERLEASSSRNWEGLQRLSEELSATSTMLLTNTEYFINETKSDTDHPDYNARVSGGLTFPYDDQDTPASGIALLNPADPKVRIVDGMMTPVVGEKHRYTENGVVDGSVQIQSYANVVHRTRNMRVPTGEYYYGPAEYHYSTFRGVPGVAWHAQSNRPPNNATKTVGGKVYTLTRFDETSPGSGVFSLTWVARDTVGWHRSDYEEQHDVESSVTAQGRAQYVFAANGGWLDQVSIHITGSGPGNVELLVCECDDAGTPDLGRTLSHTAVNGANVVQGINAVPVGPVYIAPGAKFAVVVMSTGAYNLGTSSKGRPITNGQHFALTSSNYFEVPGAEGDRDIYLKLRWKSYTATTVAVDLQPLTLSGGLDSLKLTYDRIIPAGMSVHFEVQLAGTWYRVGPGQSMPEVDWSLQPNILPFRVVFVGTTDGMPSIGVGARSSITVGRVGTSLVHISEVVDAGAQASEVRVRLLLDGFNETDHDCVISLIIGGSVVAATAVEDTSIDGNSIYRTAKFSLGASPTQTFAVKIEATIASVTDPFSISERFDYAAV